MKKRLDLASIFFICAVHAAAFFGIWYAFAQGFSMLQVGLFVLFYIGTGLGVTVGFHRLYTHNSFATHRVIREFMLAWAEAAVQGSRKHWRGVHLAHHKASDKPLDPHSPLQGSSLWRKLYGAYWSHVGWLFQPYAFLEQVVPRQSSWEHLRSFAFAVAGFLVPGFLVFPFEGFMGMLETALLVGCMRLVAVWHITWSVNSVTHILGSRPFKTPDNSRNFIIVGILAFGEGFHNGHHAFPGSARHGLANWLEKLLDSSGNLIWVLERFRLARNVIKIPKEGIKKRLTATKALA